MRHHYHVTRWSMGTVIPIETQLICSTNHGHSFIEGIHPQRVNLRQRDWSMLYTYYRLSLHLYFRLGDRRCRERYRAYERPRKHLLPRDFVEDFNGGVILRIVATTRRRGLIHYHDWIRLNMGRGHFHRFRSMIGRRRGS